MPGTPSVGFIARLTPGGQLDVRFGNQGVVLLDPTDVWETVDAVAIAGGRIVVAGTLREAVFPFGTGVFVAAVNRVGFEGPPEHGLEFWGSSFVADPFGQVIVEASQTEEEILVAECDPRRMDEVRRNWPFLRDRRIDAYSPLLQRWIG